MAGVVLATLAVGVIWLRWPTFGFNVWNVDEAIHAAVARVLMDGGILYHDAIDQRHPLTYYAVAAIFSLFGENNLWAVRFFVAGIIAVTAWVLYLSGRSLRHAATGLWAAALFAVLSTTAFYPGDAFAAHTEWFVAFFSSAAALTFLSSHSVPGTARLLVTGALFGGAFLSKQPALLELAAPLGVVAYHGWRQRSPGLVVLGRIAVMIGGWLVPVLVVAGYFRFHHVLGEAFFYSWIYNLTYYGPEIASADRVASLLVPFRLFGVASSLLMLIWGAGALGTIRQLLQRIPTTAEAVANPSLIFVTIWSVTSLLAAASGGRGFDHYAIEFLAPFCLGGGIVLGRLTRAMGSSGTRTSVRFIAALLLLVVTWQTLAPLPSARRRTLPPDPSVRISTYIAAHSQPTDKLFVWGFHPDIYLYADRLPASRYLYATFITGLIPWTNIAPGQDTSYAIVPGAMETLLQDLAATEPRFIVDCSAGPNRHWGKYPLTKFPRLEAYIDARYQPVESGQFVPQGFRLYQRRTMDEPPSAQAPTTVPVSVSATLTIGTLGNPVPPIEVSAPYGVGFYLHEGRSEYFAHSPSRLVYPVTAGATGVRGGFGIRPAAYVAENPTPTDGAVFIIRWRSTTGLEKILLQRLLQPQTVLEDRKIINFHVVLPSQQAGELILQIEPGPAGNPACDWTFWTDILIETSS
ncbi:MAG: glycosyltransferase family 39 protein [Cephaloticoccus sp.]|nr:glycosyltransferase family 39 protein [Cephaloticoccus sp.]MCF7759597.1 glycosyltransferase family 39 protein [Cephaloticoccus sp.]